MKKKIIIQVICWLGLAFLLLPSLFFPLSHDLSIYMFGGKTIAEGGKIYVDYIDLKPPLVYYLFALVYKLCGMEPLRIRLFDFIWQFGVLVSIYMLVRKHMGRQLTAFLSAGVYALSYVALNYYNTFQLETFISLPLALSIYLMLKDERKIPDIILTGLLLGVIGSLKFTFFILLPMAVLYIFIIYKKEFRKSIFDSIVLVLTSVIVFALSFIPLLDPQIRSGYYDILGLLSYYSQSPTLNFHFLLISFHSIGRFASALFSILFVIAAFEGIRRSLHEANPNSNTFNKLLFLCSLIIIFFFLSIIVERKFFNYYFSRMYLPLSILTGAGLFSFFQKIREIFKLPIFASKILIFLSLPAMILISPIPGTLFNSFIPYYYLWNKDKYYQYFETDDLNMNLDQQRKIVRMIKNDLQPDKKLMLIAIGINPVYQLSGAKRIPLIANPGLYYSKYHSKKWLKIVNRDIMESDIIVVQRNIEHFFSGGLGGSCLDLLKKDTLSYNYILNNFDLSDSLTNYLIFKRRIKQI